MTFANPLWLWGLSALVIPITIHLLSRKEGKVIAMGSLRYLKDVNSQQFKSLRLNEIVLLLLRCTLFILVVFFISGLQVTRNKNIRWVLVEERLKDNSKAISISDSLTRQGYELHDITFQLGIDGKMPVFASYWGLAEHLKTMGVSEVVILSTSRAENFKGSRVEKPISMQWITIPIPIRDYLVAASKIKKDAISIKHGIEENGNTHFKTRRAAIFRDQTIYTSEGDSVPVISSDTLKIILASDSDFSFDRQIMLAALKAIQSTVSEYLVIEESATTRYQNDSIQVLIWLSEKNTPATPARSVIFYNKNSLTPLLFQKSHSTWQLSRHLNEEIALSENLVVQLAKIILPNKTQWKIVNEKDQRVFPETMMWSKNAGKSSAGTQTAGFKPFDNYLVVFILLTWIAERLIAYKRNQ